MGFEPMNTGFADQRVSHFAIGAHDRRANTNTPAQQARAAVVPAPRTSAVPSSADTASPSCSQGRSCPPPRSTPLPVMITSSPCFQFAGVATLCFAVSCIESSTRMISSKLRPVVIGYDKRQLDALVRADHKHRSYRSIIQPACAPRSSHRIVAGQHVVQLRDLQLRIADDGIVRPSIPPTSSMSLRTTSRGSKRGPHSGRSPWRRARANCRFLQALRPLQARSCRPA